jgi:hypothetical protein
MVKRKRKKKNRNRKTKKRKGRKPRGPDRTKGNQKKPNWKLLEPFQNRQNRNNTSACQIGITGTESLTQKCQLRLIRLYLVRIIPLRKYHAKILFLSGIFILMCRRGIAWLVTPLARRTLLVSAESVYVLLQYAAAAALL